MARRARFRERVGDAARTARARVSRGAGTHVLSPVNHLGSSTAPDRRIFSASRSSRLRPIRVRLRNCSSSASQPGSRSAPPWRPRTRALRVRASTRPSRLRADRARRTEGLRPSREGKSCGGGAPTPATRDRGIRCGQRCTRDVWAITGYAEVFSQSNRLREMKASRLDPCCGNLPLSTPRLWATLTFPDVC